MTARRFWTDERFEQLKTLWGDGHSASQIVRIMGAPSRNSVLSKVRRSNLASRVDAPRAQRPPKAANVAPPPPRQDGSPVTLLNVGFSQCRYPLWGDAEHETFRVCGQPKTSDSAYCEFHKRKASGGRTRRERSAA
jgi:hypothetical protein